MADEPTGNLDSASSEVVIHTLEEINKKMGKTILLVTHDPIIASSCDRIIFLKDGRAEERICLVRRLYDRGMNSAQISELIGLDKEQVEEMLQTKSNFENNG